MSKPTTEEMLDLLREAEQHVYAPIGFDAIRAALRDRDALLARAEKAEARLAHAEPVLKAIREVPLDSLKHLVEVAHAGEYSNTRSILYAALKFSEEDK